MKAIYTHKPYSITSYLIRLFTFSKWSHCALQVTDDYIIDSTLASGVRISTVAEFNKEYPDQVIVEISVVNNTAAIDFAWKQLGKKYDWTAIVGMVIQRNWQEPDSWFCSELLEAILAAGDTQRFRDDVSRITPQQSWSII